MQLVNMSAVNMDDAIVGCLMRNTENAPTISDIDYIKKGISDEIRRPLSPTESHSIAMRYVSILSRKWLDESKKCADKDIDHILESSNDNGEQLDDLFTDVLARFLRLTVGKNKKKERKKQEKKTDLLNLLSDAHSGSNASDQHAHQSGALACNLNGLELKELPYKWYKNCFFYRLLSAREASTSSFAFPESDAWCAWREFCNHCHNRFSVALLKLEREDTSYAASVRLIRHLHEVLELVNRNPKRNLLLVDTLPDSKQELIDILTKWIEYYKNCVEIPRPLGVLEKDLGQGQDLNWTDFLKGRVKRVFGKLLSPDEPKWDESLLLSKRILRIRGAVLVWSELFQKFQEKGYINPQSDDKFDELHLIGLIIRIDQNMVQEEWHGKNVLVFAEEIHVDGYFTWDVSGMDCASHWRDNADDGKEPGQDGSPGENGLAGESGGHVYVTCMKIVNGHQWTVRSEGGRGGPGQLGGNGQHGSNGKKNLKSGMWYDVINGITSKQQAEANYRELVSSLDLCQSLEKHYEAIKKNLGNIPGKNKLEDKKGVKYFREYPPSRDGWYYLECKRKSDDGQIIVCCHQKKKKRHLLVLLQGTPKGTEGQRGGYGGKGGNGGQGGYRGSVLIRSMLDGRMLDIHPNSTAQASFLGEAVARAPNGPCGNYGRPGRDGEHRERFPDAGFIITEDSEPCITLSSDSGVLSVRFTKEKIKEKAINFVRCGVIKGKEDWKKCYATINSVDARPFSEKKKNSKHVGTPEEACKRTINKMSVARYVTDIRSWMLWAKLIGGTAYVNQQKTIFDTAVAIVGAQLHQTSTYSNKVEVTRCVNSDSFWNRRRNKNYESCYHYCPPQQITPTKLEKSCICPAISREFTDICNELFSVLRDQETEERNVHPAVDKLSYMYDPTQVLIAGRNSNLATFKLRKIKKEESMESLRSYYERLQENFIQRILISSSVIDDKKLHLHSTYNMYSLFFSNESQQSKLTFPLDLWKELADPTNHKLRRLIDADIVSEKGDESARKSITEMERWRKLIEVATAGRQNIGKEWVRAVMSCTPNLWLVLLNCLLPESSLPENFSFRDEWTEELENKHRKILAHPFRAIGLAELETLSSDTCMKFEVNVNNQAANDEELLTCSGQIINKSLPARNCIGGDSESASIRLNIEGHRNWYSIRGSQTFAKLKEFEKNKLKIDQVDGESPQQTGTVVIERLRSLLVASNENSTEVTRWIKLLDPMNGLPNWLSWLIWMRMQHVSNLSTDKQFTKDGIIALIQLVIEWMHDQNDMLTVSSIAAFACPHVWPYELLLAETIHKLKMVLLRSSSPHLDDESRKQQCDVLSRWMKMLKKLDVDILQAVRNSCLLLVGTQRYDAACKNETGSPIARMSKNEITCILEILTHDEYGKLESDQLNRLANIKLNHWLPVLKFTFWTKVVKKFIIKPFERQKALYTILELDVKRGSDWCNKEMLTKVFTSELVGNQNNQVNYLTILRAYLWSDEDNKDKLRERTFQEIANLAKESADDDKILCALEQIEKERKKSNNPKNITRSLEEVKNDISALRAKIKKKKNGREKDKEKKQKKGSHTHETTWKLSIAEFLAVFDEVVHQYKEFRLREAQRLVVTLIAKNKEMTPKSIFLEVGTGEGKSLIFAALAIYWALHGRTVDIVTVSSILAKRDSELSTSDGGLREIYQTFGISVSNNCNAQEERRIIAYKADVVYGELADFQRDYLLDSYYSKNIRGRREYDQMMIDEVDSLLLDHGNNVLYLSHDIPGMETLESLYVSIWHKVSSSKHEANSSVIKSHILYDLFGTVKKMDLVNLVRRKETAKWKHNKVQLKIVNSLWLELISIGIIDSAGKFLVQDSNQLNHMLSHLSEERRYLIPRLTYFFQNVADRPRNFNIPSFLLPFVEQNLDEWICNAKRALILQRDVDYVVNYGPARIGVQLNPVITIVDLDTGTDQASAQWDAALHQFVQLKEGCRLSLQRLRAVFISNKNYVKMYNVIGLSGTLGSVFERNYLKEAYNAIVSKIPTAIPRQLYFIESPTLINNQTAWLNAIRQQAAEVVIKKNRSMLIICRSIRDVDLVCDHLLKDDNMEGRLFSFKRDFQEFRFDKEHLDPGFIIVATCLAGRGTDIKLSEKLNDGLHVCLTFLPSNLRTEEQVFGRAGRNGAPGTCAFIILLDTNKLPSLEPSVDNDENSWSRFALTKLHRVHLEHQQLVQLSSKYSKTQSDIETVLAKHFKSSYDNLREVCMKRNYQPIERDVYCKSALDQWALWLNTFNCEEAQTNCPIIDPEYEMRLVFEDFSSRMNGFESRETPITSCPNWITPSRRIQLAKYWMSAGGECNINAAAEILDKLIKSSDAIYYPSCHYYKAYWIVRSGQLSQKKEEFILNLRSAERILKEQIEAQIAFAGIAMCWNSNEGKYASGERLHLTPYQVQKQNVVKLLEIHLSSISTMLGNWCTPKLLSQAYGKEGSETKLPEGKYILDSLCQKDIILKYRVDSSKLNEKYVIHKLSFNYGIDSKDLVEFLELIKSGASEEDLLTELKTKDLFKGRSREAFWKLLCDKKILKEPVDWLMIPEEKWNQLGIKPANDDPRALTNQQDLSSLILRDQTFLKQPEGQQLTKIFKKAVVSDLYENQDEYRKQRIYFKINKSAETITNVDKLRTLYNARKTFPNQKTAPIVVLKRDDLVRLGIPKNDIDNVFQALFEQEIIDENGYPRQIEAVFKYPECSFYESGVTSLINHIFTAEKICLEWKKHLTEKTEEGNQTETNRRLNDFLDLLPLHPNHALIADLIASGVIIPPSVTDEEKIKLDRDGSVWDLALHGFDPTNLQQVFSTNNKNIDCDILLELGKILKNNRPAYVGLKKPKATLTSLSEKFSDQTVLDARLISELDTLRLIGYDDFFELYEGSHFAGVQRWSVAVGMAGIAKIIVTILCIPSIKKLLPSLSIMPDFSPAKMLAKGILDVAYFVRCFTNKRPTLADYVAAQEENNSVVNIVLNIYNVCVGNFSSSNKEERADENSAAIRVFDKTATSVFSGYANKVTSFLEIFNGLRTMANTSSESSQSQFRNDNRTHTTIIEFTSTLLDEEQDKLNTEIGRLFDEQKYDLRNILRTLLQKVTSPVEATRILDNATKGVFIVGIITEGDYPLPQSIFTDFPRFQEECANISSLVLRSSAGQTEELKSEIQRTIQEKITEKILTRLKSLLNDWYILIQCSFINEGATIRDNSDTHESTMDEVLESIKDLITMPAIRFFNNWARQLLQDIEIRANDALSTIERGFDENVSTSINNSQEQYENFDTDSPVLEPINRPPFLKSCLSLMKKTSNPAILALILKEKKTKIPVDRYIVDAFACVLPVVLESFDIPSQKCAIRVELSSSGECFHPMQLCNPPADDYSGECNVYVVAADCVAIDRSLNQFVEAFVPLKTHSDTESDAESNEDYDCLVNCLADQINQIHKLNKPVDKMRQELRCKLASAISENASLITEAWHEYLLYFRFSGFKKRDDSRLANHIASIFMNENSISTFFTDIASSRSTMQEQEINNRDEITQ